MRGDIVKRRSLATAITVAILCFAAWGWSVSKPKPLKQQDAVVVISKSDRPKVEDNDPRRRVDLAQEAKINQIIKSSIPNKPDVQSRCSNGNCFVATKSGSSGSKSNNSKDLEAIESSNFQKKLDVYGLKQESVIVSVMGGGEIYINQSIVNK